MSFVAFELEIIAQTLRNGLIVLDDQNAAHGLVATGRWREKITPFGVLSRTSTLPWCALTIPSTSVSPTPTPGTA